MQQKQATKGTNVDHKIRFVYFPEFKINFSLMACEYSVFQCELYEKTVHKHDINIFILVGGAFE